MQKVKKRCKIGVDERKENKMPVNVKRFIKRVAVLVIGLVFMIVLALIEYRWMTDGKDDKYCGLLILIEIIFFVAYSLWNFYWNLQLHLSREAVEKEASVSNTLIKCIRVLNSHPDMDEALNKLLEIIAKYFDGDRAYIFENDYERQTTSNLYEYTIEGVVPEIDELQDVPLSTIDYWMDRFREDGTFYISDLEEEVDKNTDTYHLLKMQNIKNLIAVPLIEEREIIGFIGVDNPKQNYEDLSLLSSVVFFILDSIEKREMTKELQKMSFEDGLTKLNNRNKFNQVLDALKVEPPKSIGIVYLDLNGLKEVNDRFGHEAGDKLIKKSARIIYDIFGVDAFRIGGDEFVAIVVNDSKESFVNKIKSTKALMKQKEVSISVGASFREGNCDIEKQLADADAKMYEEKEKFYKSPENNRRKSRRIDKNQMN